MKDKILHFFCCAAIALIGALVVHALGLGVAASSVIGIYASLLAGIGKEFLDVKRHKEWSHFSWYDILADCFGTLVGFLGALLTMRGVFDTDEFFRFLFGCFIVCIFFGVILFAVIQALNKH